MPYKNPQSIEAKNSYSRRNKKYYIANKEKLLKRRRPVRAIYYIKNKNKWSNASALSTINRRKRLYGVDENCYNKMYSNQNGCCAICKIHQNKLKKVLCVDHNHNTNMVRGLLCDNCNKGIGNLKDNIEIINNAVIYLNDNND